MSEKKVLKKEIKGCNKQIKYSNLAARGFMRQQYYQPGSYRKLQNTEIWRNAKRHLLNYHRLKYSEITCFKCGGAIINNPVLHHKRYDWKKLFSPRYIEFVHRSCHTAVHSVKRGYNRKLIRLNYYQIKMLVTLIVVILILIITSILNII